MQRNNDLTKKDLDCCRALASVVSKGKFEVQGSAITQVASLILWLEGLEPKLKMALARQEMEKSKQEQQTQEQDKKEEQREPPAEDK